MRSVDVEPDDSIDARDVEKEPRSIEDGDSYPEVPLTEDLKSSHMF
jgi:hypothetical protein